MGFLCNYCLQGPNNGVYLCWATLGWTQSYIVVTFKRAERGFSDTREATDRIRQRSGKFSPTSYPPKNEGPFSMSQHSSKMFGTFMTTKADIVTFYGISQHSIVNIFQIHKLSKDHVCRADQNHVYMRCIYGIFSRVNTKYTVIHVVY
jgi:hypothetical protein